MRLFIGINFNNQIKNEIAKSQFIIKQKASKGNFVTSNNFHITMKFIGELDIGNIPLLKGIIDDSVKGISKFSISITSFGGFDNNKIIYLSVDENDSLNCLFKYIDSGLKSIIKTDSRPFTPHVTLGRNIIISNFSEISQYIANIKVEVDNLTLFESKRINGLLCYIPLYQKSLE